MIRFFIVSTLVLTQAGCGMLPGGGDTLSRADRKLLEQGAVCGDIALQGSVIGDVPGRISGCGIEDAVQLTSVSGISLSQSATIDCPTARALKTWVDSSAKPALARKGGGLKALRVAAHYACRPRNNQSGAKISEHGRGKAIDISGFQLADGEIISVENGWGSGQHRRAMRRMHGDACGPFGTVLGPESDRFHLDHFHFDTASHRGGAYCR